MMKRNRRLTMETLGNRELLTSVFGTTGDDAPAPTGVTASDGTFSDRVEISWNPTGSTGAAWGYRAYNSIVDEAQRAGDFVVTVTLTDSDTMTAGIQPLDLTVVVSDREDSNL